MLNTDRLCLGCMNDNGGEQICGICGYQSSTNNNAESLPTRLWLNDRFLVGRVINNNSRGITYIGWDNANDSIVHICEYFPAFAAKRNADKTVFIAEGEEYPFNEGLMQFIERGKKLMSAELTALVPTIAVFEENGTAYAVTASFSGITLQDFLERNGGTLKWEQARPLFLPLIDTIKGLHHTEIIHGCISPETILVGRDGKLRINTMCMGKTDKETASDSLPLYPGFAALEQYSAQNAQIGTYTDVYGLSATLFRVLIGTVPPEANARLKNDNMTIPARFAQELPRYVLTALANGLQVKPELRTATIEGFKNELVYGDTPNAVPVKQKAAAPVQRPAAAPAKNAKPEKAKNSGAKYAVISALCTALVFIIIAGVLSLTVFRSALFPKKDTPADASDFVSAPSVASIGDVDSDAAVSAKLYSVPDVLGKYYSQIIDNVANNEDYEKFEFVIKGKEYSSKYAKGMVCAQSIPAGTSVSKETTVALTISLGPQELKIANVVGLDEVSAKLELLKQGFLYENIEVVDKYDSEAKPGVVLEQTPTYGTVANTEIKIRIFLNSYTGNEEDENESSSRSN